MRAEPACDRPAMPWQPGGSLVSGLPYSKHSRTITAAMERSTESSLLPELVKFWQHGEPDRTLLLRERCA